MARRRQNEVLNFDVIRNILQRLPSASLSRFRCVCRRWCNYINSPTFVEQELYRASRREFLFVCYTNEDGDTHFFSIDRRNNNAIKYHDELTVDYPEFDIYPVFHNTCLELVCMHDDDDIYLCNPTTEERVILPRSGLGPVRAVGFGYASREYKVVQVCENECMVLTVEQSCQWRVAENPPFGVLSTWPTFVNRVLHFLPVDDNTHRLATFDVRTETWGQLQPPNDLREHLTKYSTMLRELQGFLSISYGTNVWELIDIWMLKDYDECVWTKEYTINISQWRDMELRLDMVPVLIEDDGRILVHRQDLQELYYYDPMTQTFSKMEGVDAGRICRYVDSFFRLENVAE